MIRRIVTTGVSLSVAASGLLLTSPTGLAAPSAAAAAGTTPTHYALSASGYSTRISGGQLPAGSDKTAFQVIGCTNKAGLNKSNTEVGVNLSPLVRVKGATTNVSTTQKNGVVTSRAENNIARAVLGQRRTGATLVVKGIKSVSRAFHGSKGFHAKTNTRVASIQLDLDGSGGAPPALDVQIPTVGNPVIVDGIAKISLGHRVTRHDRHGALASADALRVRLFLTNTTVYLAHSRATINDGVVSGVFKGSAYASKVNAANGTVTSGKTPLIVMPCQGTNGKVIRRDVARVNPKGLVIKGLHADESADQTAKTAFGYERGRVARVRIFDATNRIVVRGIVGKANVRYAAGQGVTTNTKGSAIFGVRVGGSPRAFGADGVIKVGGVAKLEAHIVNKNKRSIQVTELRITLLGGANNGVEVDLGVAKVGFTKSAF